MKKLLLLTILMVLGIAPIVSAGLPVTKNTSATKIATPVVSEPKKGPKESYTRSLMGVFTVGLGLGVVPGFGEFGAMLSPFYAVAVAINPAAPQDSWKSRAKNVGVVLSYEAGTLCGLIARRVLISYLFNR